MTTDLNGIAVLIGAVVAGIGSLATTIMQWKASRKAEANKQEAMAARHEQTNAIIQSAVVPALNTPVPPPTPPEGPS